MRGPTLVLLHGVGLDHTVWAPVIDLLGDRFHVVAPDLPGHGQQRAVPDGVTLAELANGIADLVPPKSHVVGFSLGALIAQHLAVHRPDLVATLTSVNSVCRRTDQERAAVLARLDTAQADQSASTEASIHRWFDGTDVPDEIVRSTRKLLQSMDPESFVRCYRVFATADAEIAPQLDRIAMPALAVTGELDPGSTPEMTRRLASAIRGCSAVVVPGARHMLPIQNPTALVEALLEFLGRTPNA